MRKVVYILHTTTLKTTELSYATNAPSEDNKIKFNEFIAKPYLIVKHNGEKVHVFKDEIYAYKNKKDVIRTWNFTPYYFSGEKDTSGSITEMCTPLNQRNTTSEEVFLFYLWQR